jgi:uncharacterized protein YdaU (DUF1376 family)
MKLGYFLRGLGIGIVFCAIIMMAASRTSDSSMTDEEVIARAKELGMVEQDASDDALDALFADTASDDADEQTEEDTTSEETTESATTQESSTETATTEEVTEQTTQEATTETPADTTQEVAVTDSNASQTVTFSITRGMYSEKVASTLAYLGVIDDAAAFNQYLSDYGYASRLVVGTYEVTKGEDYDSIARKITTK